MNAKRPTTFVMPTIENDFLGHGSFEAFILHYQDKFEDEPKKGAFKLIIEVPPSDYNDEGAGKNQIMVFFLVRDIRLEDGDLSFFYMQKYPEFSEDFDAAGSHIRQRLPEETFLDYFKNLEDEWNGYWVECTISAPVMVRIIGQFAYYSGIGLVETDNKFASGYAHPHPKKKKEEKEPGEAIVVSLADRRDKNDKTD